MMHKGRLQVRLLKYGNGGMFRKETNKVRVGNCLSIFILICISKPVLGGYCGADFLNMGVGARPLGMGGAFCSLCDDGTSFYWNPAGLAFLDRAQLSGMYGNQFGSFGNSLGNYHYIGLAHPVQGRAVLSVNWIRLAVDDIPVYPELAGSSYWERLHDPSLRPTGEPDGYITDTEDAVFFTVALLNKISLDLGWEYHRITVEIPFGLNVKWIRQTLGKGEATGIGLDIGTMIRCHLNDFMQDDRLGVLSFGLNIQDITGTNLGWNTRHMDRVPLSVKWGISYKQPLSPLKSVLSFSFDRDSRWYKRNRLGVEFEGFHTIRIRAGFDASYFTGGVGIQFWIVQVDYAFLSHELDASHRISCSLSL